MSTCLMNAAKMRPPSVTAGTITKDKYTLPPPIKLQNLPQCVMASLMQRASSAHAQLMEFRKQDISGYVTANGRTPAEIFTRGE